MDKFTLHRGILAPLDRANVDTDQIIPKQFLKSIDRSGFGKQLFFDWRYLDPDGRTENPEFILNQPAYRQASVLLCRQNFGCGSSREHAPWALQGFGFRAIVAPSFADIFHANCLNIGLLPIRLPAAAIDSLFELCHRDVQRVVVDLNAQTLHAGDREYSFPVDEFSKYCLLEGIDSIAWTLRNSQDAIADHEKGIPAWRQIRKAE